MNGYTLAAVGKAMGTGKGNGTPVAALPK